MKTAAYSAIAAPLAMIFRLNDDIVLRSLEGLSDEELWRRQTGRNNPILWVAGHVVQTRTVPLKILGEEFDTGWGNLFARGATLLPSTTYPSREQIQQVMSDVSRRLDAKLASVGDDQLVQPGAGPDVPGGKTVADQIAFFALHDSYHVGQMAFIRKGLGYSGLTG